MDYITLEYSKGITYHWCGRFVAPGEEWTHMTRNLMDYELMVVQEGVLSIADHEREYTVHAGEYLLMTPTSFQHGARTGYCSFLWMHFGYHAEQNDHELSHSAPAYQPGFLTIPRQGTLTSLDRLVILMKQLQDSDRRYREVTLNAALCTAVLGEIAVQSPDYHTYGTLNSKDQIYSDICDYIGWHISENLRVSEVAEYFGYNEKYLTTFFGRMAGISLKQYILQEKMEHAKAALSESNQTVSEVAYSLGFSDPHNFTNAFKKITGLTPTEYKTGYNSHNVFQV